MRGSGGGDGGARGAGASCSPPLPPRLRPKMPLRKPDDELVDDSCDDALATLAASSPEARSFLRPLRFFESSSRPRPRRAHPLFFSLPAGLEGD